MTSDMVGWLGNILIVVGLWRLGAKHRDAFAFTIVGELLWVAKAGSLGMWDLAAICFIFAILATRNAILWSRP